MPPISKSYATLLTTAILYLMKSMSKDQRKTDLVQKGLEVGSGRGGGGKGGI